MVGLAALLATLALVAAQPAGAVRGRLINQLTGLPVAGAEITIVGERGSVRTDDAGRFQWLISPRFPIDIIVVLREQTAHELV